uniref:RDRP3-5 N-terminal domain-containing protein n=1 Tax=Fagus sylvatica TaxID=28930 RepID=A0A2N9HUS3_FAGSY
MADPSVHVALPQAVEQLIEQICRDQNQLPPNVGVRQKLALIGEEEAVQVLRNISAWKITKSLSGIIMNMIRKSKSNIEV